MLVKDLTFINAIFITNHLLRYYLKNAFPPCTQSPHVFVSFFCVNAQTCLRKPIYGLFMFTFDLYFNHHTIGICHF